VNVATRDFVKKRRNRAARVDPLDNRHQRRPIDGWREPRKLQEIPQGDARYRRRKRSRELDNTPFSKFLQGYAPEVKQWFDAYGPSNWGTLSRETSSMVAVGEVHALGGEKRKR
jgi:hypothetical protein